MKIEVLRQCFVVAGAAVNIIGHGCVHGYPSVLFTQLEMNGGDPVKLTDHDTSWIGSMIGIVSIVGIIMSPILMSKLGRQKAHLACTLPAIVGWAIFIFGNSVSLFIIARILHGLSIGIRFPLAAILVAEYTDPKLRGMFLGTFAVSLGIGIFLSHLVGAYLTWRMTAAFCGLFPLVAMIIMFLSPESPSWLISKGKFDEAKRAFDWLRGEGKEQTSEFQEMVASQESYLTKLEKREKRELNENRISLKGYWDTFVINLKRAAKIFKKDEFYKPLIVAITMLFMFEFCGSHVFPAYGHVILQSVLGKEDPKSVEWQFTILDLLRTISAFVAAYLLKRFKRRTLLFTSTILTIISMTAISLFIYLRRENVIQDTKTLDIIALTLMVAYTLSYCMGIVPLNWVICGEVFPLSYRSLGSTISMVFWTPSFVITMKSAPHLFSSVGVEGAFLVFATTLAVSMIILYFLLPETKDKTLQDIENSFKRKGTRDSDKSVEMRLINNATVEKV